MGLFGNKDAKDAKTLEESLETLRANIGANSSMNGIDAVDGGIDACTAIVRRLGERGAGSQAETCLVAAAATEPQPTFMFRGSYDEAEAKQHFEEQLKDPDWPLRVRRWQDALLAIRDQALAGRSDCQLRELDSELEKLHRLIGSSVSSENEPEITAAVNALASKARSLTADGRADRVVFRLDRAASWPVAAGTFNLWELMKDPDARARAQAVVEGAEQDLSSRQTRYNRALALIRDQAPVPTAHLSSED